MVNEMAIWVGGMSGSLRDSYRTWFMETVKMKAARAPLRDYREQGTRGWKTVGNREEGRDRCSYLDSC